MATEPEGPREPAERLSPLARWVWRLNWALGSAAALLAGMLLGDELDGALGTAAWAVPLASLLIGTVVVPELRYRRWRWEVREGEVDIQSGVLTLRRSLIPMPRVQHVETTRGILEQALGLATVQIHTAAGGHTIPLLHASHADRIRERIAELARTDDDG
jgi:membrane protein YdbS with pleckstrin-like domain